MFAQTWTPTSAPSIEWNHVASSADGNRLFAAGSPYIYGLSTNAGATWTTNVEPQFTTNTQYGSWACIASSVDGNTLIAMNGNGVWASTNSGLSWNSNSVVGVNLFASVALSADGQKAVAVDGYGGSHGGIYTSTNSGINWSQTTAPIEPWTSVASSADGTFLVAAAYDTGPPTIPVYVSTNSGMTWLPIASPTNMNPTCVAASVDGRKLVLAGADVVNTGNWPIYTSTNYGNSWTSNDLAPYSYWWSGVASSADGTRLVAVANAGGCLFTSTNSGATWVSNGVPTQSFFNWLGVAASADGTKLAAASVGNGSGGGIYTLQSTPSPQLQLTLSGLSPTLAWTIPSTNFILQQSSDLTSTNWSNVTNTPVLDYTNLQYLVTLPASVANSFYRLKTP